MVVVLYDVRVGWDLDLCRAAWSNGVDCWVRTRSSNSFFFPVSASFCIVAPGPILAYSDASGEYSKGKAGWGNQCRDEINHEAIKLEMMGEENMAFPAAGEESEQAQEPRKSSPTRVI